MNYISRKKLKQEINKGAIKGQKKGLQSLMPEILVLLVFAVLVLNTMLFFSYYKYFTVKQNSMRPLLNNYENSNISDGVFVNVRAKFTVGDVVVINQGQNIIKRIIGMPGDKIAVTDRINDNNELEFVILRIAAGTLSPYTMEENYLSEEAKTTGMQTAYQEFVVLLSKTPYNKKTQVNDITYLVLGDNEVFYLGDNRKVSEDSSNHGAADISKVVGKVEIIVKKEQNMLYHILCYLLGFKKV